MMPDESGPSRTSDSSSDDRRRVAMVFGCFAMVAFAIIVISIVQLWMLAPERDVDVAEPSAAATPDNSLERLVDSEEWILARSAELSKLNQSCLNLRIPDHTGPALFAEQVDVRDLEPIDASLTTDSAVSVSPETAIEPIESGRNWVIETDAEQISLDKLEIWAPLLSKLTVMRAKFYFVDAYWVDEMATQIDTTVGFEGLTQDATGGFVVIKAKQKLRWRVLKPKQSSVENASSTQWRITRWDQVSMYTTERDELMFQDVAEYSIVEPELRERFRMTQHERELIRIGRGDDTAPHKYFNTPSNARHPSVSVVDIDQDGWDDLYLMPRLGRNILLRNQGDGSFVNIAADLGLDIDSFCSSALFADFDNDGDADLMLGRTLRRSMYLENEDGQFVDRTSEQIGTLPPMLVYSVSAADYNGDGSLDVFFATGAQHITLQERNLVNERGSAFEASKMMYREFLSEEKARKAFEHRANHVMFARVGPPNLLLANRGGRFEEAPENEQVELYRNSTQGTWGDYDGDGDPDLYVSNDYAINNMLRNDGDRGFVDVTQETETGDIGFGMGVAWGDYNNDKRLDLYVSNMFSKAGRRITAQVESIDERTVKMANGNTLFRNDEGSFAKVSGLKAPKLLVEKVGWSWGSQFMDVNNDGFLDIYALSGFYTAPKEVAVAIDL